jgi:hypothetical protein
MRQAAHDLDTVPGQEASRRAMGSGGQDGQVAAIDHPRTESGQLFDEPEEIGIHFGGPAGQIDGGDAVALDGAETMLHRRAGHDLGALRAGIHVAMGASLVAHLAEVDLENVDTRRGQGGVPVAGQHVVEFIGQGDRGQHVELPLRAGEIVSAGLERG